MKKPHSRKNIYKIIGIVILTLLLLSLVGYLKREGLQRRWYGHQVQSELSQQIQPLTQSFSDIGFTNLPKAKVDCEKAPTAKLGQSENACMALIKKYIVVGSGETVSNELDKGASELSKHLESNGWKQRKDLPVTTWFHAIGQGIDYQPDQLDLKQIGNNITCTIDITTAFSKPKPPAINLVMTCEKPALPEDILGPNF
jgi:hypothetical protein